MILIALFATLASSLQIPQCLNNGVPILTRTKIQPYSLQYQCLCPFDYFGVNCQNHRNIMCITNQQSMEYQDQVLKNKLKLTFDMKCILITFVYSSTWIQTSQNHDYTNLPLTPLTEKSEYSQKNYYINPKYDIIWANNTKLFDNYSGELVRTDNDTRTDQQILEEYPKHEFSYNSKFMGVPLQNSVFEYNLTVIRFRNSSIALGKQNVTISSKLDVNNITFREIVSFEISPNWDIAQFQVLRLQITIIQLYGKYQIPHKISMNSPKWLIANPDATKGDYLTGQSTISSKVWVLIVSIAAILGVLLIKTIFNAYKKRKSKKMLLSLQQQLAYNQK